jgi:ribonuclease P protein component
MSRATFPAAARLHRPTEYAAALSGRRVARGAYFIVTAHHTSPTDSIQSPATAPQARLGLVMAKRHAQLASTRNALKRVVREAFRAQRLTLPPADYVVRLHRRVENISLTALKLAARQEADQHFARAKK